ncbi:MAG: biopolymer transporter ExbD [Zoogloeaceae bacterium]|nr:biopolymer transporter ExbD [Zoogloeaceae bacterium]
MAFASMDTGDDDEPLAEINMVPLIDVMLVLLIIFMVTAPLLTHAVKLDLPQASSTTNQSKPDSVHLAITADRQVLWNGQPVDAAALSDQMTTAGRLQPVPELHIHAERNTPYERVAQVMSEASQKGLTRIGFVTDPSASGR